MKYYFIIFSFFLCFSLFALEENHPKSKCVLVSIAPYKYFVDAIVDNTANVELLVPPGASFHTYEPTAKQVVEGCTADIWFRVGETFETKALQALKAHNPKMVVVDLRNGVDLITVDEGHHHCCHHEGADLHMWLSPHVAGLQVQMISHALQEIYPENKAVYQRNEAELLKKLDALDREISSLLSPVQNRIIMVSHPAYAYFARDYNFKQLPIEFEGKDPSPRQLTQVLDNARAAKINTIYVQNQYSRKGADLIARELGAKVVTLDPYSGDYFNSIRQIARTIFENNSK